MTDLDERESLGGSRGPRRTPTTSLRAPQVPAQNVPKALATRKIDDEVNGRIQHLERVRCVEQVEADVSAALHFPAGRHLHNTCRSVTHHEHDNDDHHHQGDVVFIRQTARRHSPSAALRAPEGDDDARVHIGQ